AAYVPLDPAMPKKRVARMMDDAEVRAIVTTGDLVHLVEGQPGARPLCLDDAGEQITCATPETLAASGADSAYVMYTSGSNGEPNGVEITHSALVNCLLAVQDMLEFSQSSSLLAISTPSFDISTAELFMPLIAGGTVQLGEQGLLADGMR